MMEFAKITGNMDGNFIEVTMRTGESLYAPLVTMGADVSLPSEKWINDNKNSFLAVVGYEKSSVESPMIMGFFPVRSADSSKYNTHERLLEVSLKLLEQLMKAKVNTMLGPQPFMPDTIKALTDMKKELENIKELILPVKL